MKQTENSSIRRHYLPGKPITSRAPVMQMEMFMQAEALRNKVYAEFPQCSGCEYPEHFFLSLNPAIYDVEVVRRHCRGCNKYVPGMEDFTVRHGYASEI